MVFKVVWAALSGDFSTADACVCDLLEEEACFLNPPFFLVAPDEEPRLREKVGLMF